MRTTRKFVTTCVGYSFLVVGVTGVIFKLLFKNKVLEDIHGWLGLALVAAALCHVFQNWTSLRGHFRDRRVLLPLIPIVAVIAGFALVPRDASEGTTPRVVMRKLAEGTVADVARAFGKDPGRVVAALTAGGVSSVAAGERLADVARRSGKPPEAILAYFVR